MSRHTTRTRITRDYSLFHSNGTTNDYQAPVVIQEINQPDEMPSIRRRRTVFIAPPLKDGEVECTFCKMRFTDPEGASQKHNRHHPECALFDRELPWKDASALHFDSLLLWMSSLTVSQLQNQLKLYYHKSSGNKTTLLARLESAVRSPPVDIGIGSKYHRSCYTTDKLRVSTYA